MLVLNLRALTLIKHCLSLSKILNHLGCHFFLFCQNGLFHILLLCDIVIFLSAVCIWLVHYGIEDNIYSWFSVASLYASLEMQHSGNAIKMQPIKGFNWFMAGIIVLHHLVSQLQENVRVDQGNGKITVTIGSHRMYSLSWSSPCPAVYPGLLAFPAYRAMILNQGIRVPQDPLKGVARSVKR